MLHCLKQEEFEPKPFDDTGLNVHERANQYANTVVLFVHGLAGGGYSTWRMWPQMVFEAQEIDPLDVAVYDYPSFYKSWFKERRLGANLEAHAAQLADLIRRLADRYQDIYIVAHSLGGLLSEAAVHKYIAGLGKQATEMTGVAALVLLASPRSGSAFAPSPARLIVPEFRWLHRHSKQAAEADNFFSTYVESKAVASAVHRAHVLPRYVASANYDRVVQSMSANFGVPEHQRLHLKGSHKSLVKPTRENNPQHRWLLEIVRTVQALRAQWRRTQDHQQRKASPVTKELLPYLVTELRSHRARARWERAYNEARAAASKPDLAVYDHRHTDPHTPVDLLITVHDAKAVIEKDAIVRETISIAYSDHEKQRQMSVVVSPVGVRHTEAEDIVLTWLPSQQHRAFSVAGARNADHFKEILVEWIDVVASRDTRRNLMKSDNDLAPEIDYFDLNARGEFL